MKDESLVEVPRDQKVHVPHAAEHLDGPPSNGLNNLAGGGIEDHHRSNGHINGQHRLVGVQEPPQLTQAHSDQHSDDGHKPLQHTQPLALAQEVAHEQQQLPRGLLHPPALYKHEHVLNTNAPVHRCPRDIAEDQPTNLQPSNAMAGQHVQNQRAAPPEQEVPQNQDPQGTHAQGEWMGTRHPLQGHHSADQKTGPHAGHSPQLRPADRSPPSFTKRPDGAYLKPDMQIETRPGTGLQKVPSCDEKVPPHLLRVPSHDGKVPPPHQHGTEQCEHQKAQTPGHLPHRHSPPGSVATKNTNEEKAQPAKAATRARASDPPVKTHKQHVRAQQQEHDHLEETSVKMGQDHGRNAPTGTTDCQVKTQQQHPQASQKSSVASSNSSIASIHGTHPNAHDPAGEGHKKDPTRKLRGGDGATALGREIHPERPNLPHGAHYPVAGRQRMNLHPQARPVGNYVRPGGANVPLGHYGGGNAPLGQYGGGYNAPLGQYGGGYNAPLDQYGGPMPMAFPPNMPVDPLSGPAYGMGGLPGEPQINDAPALGYGDVQGFAQPFDGAANDIRPRLGPYSFRGGREASFGCDPAIDRIDEHVDAKRSLSLRKESWRPEPPKHADSDESCCSIS